jgi:hypothetical protein
MNNRAKNSTTMKTLVAVALLELAALSGWAQGSVDFRNGGAAFATTADRLVYLDRVGGIKLTGTNYVAGLWFAIGAGNQTVDRTGGIQAGLTFSFRAATTASPGTWNAGPNPFIFTLEGTGPGSPVTLQVRVWDSVKYNSFAAALGAGEFGVSTPFDYRIPIGGDTSPWRSSMDGLRAFPVALSPEPSTLALGVLGVAGLLVLRRRR